MSVFATVTLVMAPVAAVCLLFGQRWWFRRHMASMTAERDRAVEVSDRLGDGLQQVIDFIDWEQPDKARIVAERALEVSTYAGDLRTMRMALEKVAAENALLRGENEALKDKVEAITRGAA